MIIFGVGGFAEIVARYIGLGNVDAFTVDGDHIESLEFMGKRVVPFEEIGEQFPPPDHGMIIAVTQQNGHRGLMKTKAEEAMKAGYWLGSFVHASAVIVGHIWVMEASQNCIIGPSAIIEPEVKLGDGVIVRSGAYIGHHCHLECYSYIAPRASMSGYVRVGEGAFIGNNATIRDRVTIGWGAVVGAGAVVLRDVAPGEVYQGYPARLLRDRKSVV